jgi:hypothetical protein
MEHADAINEKKDTYIAWLLCLICL